MALAEVAAGVEVVADEEAGEAVGGPRLGSWPRAYRKGQIETLTQARGNSRFYSRFISVSIVTRGAMPLGIVHN